MSVTIIIIILCYSCEELCTDVQILSTLNLSTSEFHTVTMFVIVNLTNTFMLDI
jgi:hypothetical protein